MPALSQPQPSDPRCPACLGVADHVLTALAFDERAVFGSRVNSCPTCGGTGLRAFAAPAPTTTHPEER